MSRQLLGGLHLQENVDKDLEALEVDVLEGEETKKEKAIKSYRKFAQKKIDQEVGKITLDQGLALILLNRYPDLPQNEIAELIFKDNASLTRMIELMSKKSLLKRTINPADRRRFKLKVTDDGMEVLEKLSGVIANNRKVALKGISKSEIEQIKKLEVISKTRYTNSQT